jgi:hypothetical protein
VRPWRRQALRFLKRPGPRLDSSHLDRRFNRALPDAARCVAAGGDGTLLVGLRDHIEVFNAEGQRLGIWDSPGKKCRLTALAVSESDVFSADSGSRLLLRYERSGKLVSRIGEKNRERNVPGFIIPIRFPSGPTAVS